MPEVNQTEQQTASESTHDAILKQVEFYFGDNNLPFDKFLYTESTKNDGWVPIETICAFKRMRRFQPIEEVVAAIRKSKDLLEVSEDGKQVRRRTPLVPPEADEQKLRFERTVYAKGFGKETETSQLDIEKFFEKYGKINQVRLRRADDGTFKESVFAEFADPKDAESFVKSDPKPKFQENELVVMSKPAYVAMKAEQHNFSNESSGRRKLRFNAFREMKKKKNSERRGRSGMKRKRSDDQPDSKRNKN